MYCVLWHDASTPCTSAHSKRNSHCMVHIRGVASGAQNCGRRGKTHAWKNKSVSQKKGCVFDLFSVWRIFARCRFHTSIPGSHCMHPQHDHCSPCAVFPGVGAFPLNLVGALCVCLSGLFKGARCLEGECWILMRFQGSGPPGPGCSESNLHTTSVAQTLRVRSVKRSQRVVALPRRVWK